MSSVAPAFHGGRLWAPSPPGVEAGRYKDADSPDLLDASDGKHGAVGLDVKIDSCIAARNPNMWCGLRRIRFLLDFRIGSDIIPTA